MANTPNARKATRKIARRTAVTSARRSRVRTYIRRVEKAIAAGDKAQANAALREAEPEVMRAVSKGVFHRNAGARTVSRLTRRVNAIGA